MDVETAINRLNNRTTNINNLISKTTGLFIYTSDNCKQAKTCEITCTDVDQQIFFMFGMNAGNSAGAAVFSTNTRGAGKSFSSFGSTLVSNMSVSSSSVITLNLYEWSHFTIFSTDEFSINIK